MGLGWLELFDWCLRKGEEGTGLLGCVGVEGWVGWGEAEGCTGYIDTLPGAQQWGLMFRYLVLFQ